MYIKGNITIQNYSSEFKMVCFQSEHNKLYYGTEVNLNMNVNMTDKMFSIYTFRLKNDKLFCFFLSI